MNRVQNIAATIATTRQQKTLALIQKEKKKRGLIEDPHNVCTLFDQEKGFKPQPGGQTAFWSYVPFNPITSIPERAIFARGGRGAGKSYAIGAAFICSRAYADPEGIGLISANEYDQLKDSTLLSLARFCDHYNIPLIPRGGSPKDTAEKIANKRSCKIFKADIIVKSANKFQGSTSSSSQAGRGTEIRSAWLDEWPYAQADAFETVLASLGRGSGTLDGLVIVTGTINRNNPYNWVWEYFDSPDRSEEKKEMYRSFVLKTKDNASSFDKKFVAGLEAAYTDELALIEIEGEYAVSAVGRLFSGWNRTHHLDGGIEYIPGQDVYLSFDFNRSPMTCLCAQIVRDEIRVFKEFYLLNADSFIMGDRLLEYLKSLKVEFCHITGDATGNSHTSNSKKSNWEIILDAFRKEEDGPDFVTLYGKVNPQVVDTVISCNAMFNKNRLLISPECKELIKDLDSVSWKEGVKPPVIDKSDPLRTHPGDCLRYLVESTFPYSDLLPPPPGQEVYWM